MMKSTGEDWYKKIWTLDIVNQSWVEDTKRQVDFIVKKLHLNGREKILDLACGFGRHSIELARRGFSVTGVDITEDYVNYASELAAKEKLDARFILSDIRGVDFAEEFDVVLNMADGAVGYLENDDENMKIFNIVSRALKRGGKHFMDIMSADYADSHFPCKLWDEGEHGLTLSKFEWNRQTRTMLYGQLDFQYGKELPRPLIEYGNPTRLYSRTEVNEIMISLGMRVNELWSDFGGKPYSVNDIQMMVYSEKTS